MHNVIRCLDAEATQNREMYQQQSPQHQNSTVCSLPNPQQTTRDQTAEMPLSTSVAGQNQAMLQLQRCSQTQSRVLHDQNRISNERQSCQNTKRGRRALEYTEPIPPTKVCPSELSKARLEYMQVN